MTVRRNVWLGCGLVAVLLLVAAVIGLRITPPGGTAQDWRLVSGYSASVVSYLPTGSLAPGYYTILVLVRAAGSSVQFQGTGQLPQPFQLTP